MQEDKTSKTTIVSRNKDNSASGTNQPKAKATYRAAGSSGKGSSVTVKEHGNNHKEIIAVIIISVCIFLIVCVTKNAGLIGNVIRMVLFGVLGGYGTMAAIIAALVVAMTILRGTEAKVFRTRNVVLISLIYGVSTSLFHTLANLYKSIYTGSENIIMIVNNLWSCADSNFFGGGLIGGGISTLMQYFLTKVGTLFILVPAAVVLAMALFSFSIKNAATKVAGGIKKSASGIKNFAAKVSENRKASKKAAEEKDKSKNETPSIVHGRNTAKNTDSENEGIILTNYTDNKGSKTQKNSGKLIEGSSEQSEIEDESGVTSTTDTASEENPEDFFGTDEPSESSEETQETLTVSNSNGETPVLYEKKYEGFVQPGFELLKDAESSISPEEEKEAALESADNLQKVLKSFDLSAKVTQISIGPTVTRFELVPDSGVRINKIKGLSDDIALNLAAQSIRIEAPIPGKAAIGIELPNKNPRSVYLKEIAESAAFKQAQSKLSFCLGCDISGAPIIVDLEKMPHLMIAGTTGSGKSVCTNSIIVSMLLRTTPNDVRFVLIDPKIVEFSKYNKLPNLIMPVVSEPKKAAAALNWAVAEMEKRYRLFADYSVKDITSYNRFAEKNKLPSMPRIVIIIDELADLMMVARNSVETAINRIAQKARAAGMHMVLATQRPSVDVITGLIKSNVPSRIALRVSEATNSRIIIDQVGAEKLIGHGDMLYNPSGASKPVRVQGCFVSDEEIEGIVSYIIENNTAGEYSESIIKSVNEDNAGEDGEDAGEQSGDKLDAFFNEAVKIAIEQKSISTSYLQRRLNLGYNRAARIIDQMEAKGIVGVKDGNNPRKVLVDHYEGVC